MPQRHSVAQQSTSECGKLSDPDVGDRMFTDLFHDGLRKGLTHTCRLSGRPRGLVPDCSRLCLTG